MSRTRVLLCDDTKNIVLLLSMELGFNEDIEIVGAAENGKQAIELARVLQPDVVLLDLAMPVMTGLEALPGIREVAPGAQIIVLSGFEAQSMASKALELGARRYLEKGTSPDDIAAAILETAGSPPATVATEPAASKPLPRDLESLHVVVAGNEQPTIAGIEASLRAEGADVYLAADGDAALSLVAEASADLVLLDSSEAKIDALEVSRRLRSDPATQDVPIVVLTAKSVEAEELAHMTSTANDYLVKPFDPIELHMRVRSALRRTHEANAINPLTFLPGNVQIERELKRRTQERRRFALMYVDLDNFKAFNDRYGFLRGDEAIRLEATCTSDAVHRHAPEGFVGHVGGDDVIALVDPASAEAIARDIVAAWDRGILALYDPEDVARGHIEVADRLGTLQRYPIATISIGVASNLQRPETTHWEASEIAAEMKRFAKREPGSHYRFDRRSAEDRRAEPGAPPQGGERRQRVIRLDS